MCKSEVPCGKCLQDRGKLHNFRHGIRSPRQRTGLSVEQVNTLYKFCKQQFCLSISKFPGICRFQARRPSPALTQQQLSMLNVTKKLDLKKFCLYSFNKLIRCVSCSAFGERLRKNSTNVIREVYK